MRILVTGGFGYIGGRLVSYIKKRCPESEIIIADRVLYTIPFWAHGIKRLPLELSSEENVEECVAKSKPECIIHLAALNEIDCVKDPELADKVNRIGTELLVENALKHDVKSIVYFSTFHVYGKNAKGLITEKTSPNPTHPYAITHLKAEKAIASANSKGIKTIVFRLSNGYGYPMDIKVNRWTLLVNDLCRQAVTTGKMLLASSGRQKRNFISLGNIREAVRYFLYDIPDKWGDGLYNLGSGETISVFEMAEKVKYIYEKKYKKRLDISVSHDDLFKQEDAIDFEYSIDKLERTGFQLKDLSEEEISKTMDICESLI